MDLPAPELSSAEVVELQNQHFRWNYAVNSLDVIFFMSGISLLSATTILPLFISKLTSSTIPLALVAIISQSGFFLPQLFTSNFVERLHRKKPVIVNLGLFTERLPTVLMVLSPLAAIWSPLLALILFMLFYSWFNFGGGVVATAWQDLVARCFPAQWRGRFFGGNMFIGTAIGVGAATLAGRVLDSVSYPFNFAYIFGAASVLICLSWLFLAQTREPVERVNLPRRTMSEYISELPDVVRRDDNFRAFLIARFMLTFAEMGSGFLTVYAIQQWAVLDSTVAFYTTATLIGQMAASLMMGLLADRYGHRLSLELATLAGIGAFGLAWFAPSPDWYYGVFFLLGFFTGARIVSATMVVLEFCEPAKRPTYVGIANTLSGIGSTLAPLIGAALVGISFSWAFAASLIAALATFLMLRFWVAEPRNVARVGVEP